MNEEIFELIGEKKYARLRELLSEMNPADIAQILEDVPERELPERMQHKSEKSIKKRDGIIRPLFIERACPRVR